ncbi:MAG TPA: hypothetical protein VFC84_01235 [Desulfosporosinus sp.]|nr:hypothetical protein [Desulfosporosinus sp.]
MAGGTRPCVPPRYERGFKAEFGYDLRKGVRACDREPLSSENVRVETDGVCDDGRKKSAQ